MKILVMWDIRKGLDEREKGRARTALHRATASGGKGGPKYRFSKEAKISPSVLLLEEGEEKMVGELEREFSKWFDFKIFRVE